jgi:hypothetical protein
MLLVRLQNRHLKDILKEHWPNDANTELLTRAATPVGNTTTPTWAAELAGRGIADFTNILAPTSAGAAVLERGLQFTFDGGISVGVPALLAASTDASFVSQGSAIPVRKFSTGVVSLEARKLATISVFTRELLEHSIPNAELLVRTAVTESLGLVLDSKMFDAVAGDTVRPAGLLNGISVTTASAASPVLEAMKEDVGALVTKVAAVAGSSPILIVAAPAQAAALKMWRTGGEGAYQVFASGALAAGTVIAKSFILYQLQKQGFVGERTAKIA